MPFRVIPGRFHVVGYSPDGDSMRFAPDDIARLSGLAGPPARINARGHVQLRFEGVDTLETHYSAAGTAGSLHQPLALAHAAGDRLMAFSASPMSSGTVPVAW